MPWVLLESDLQGAEARVVALLSKDYTTLKLFDSVDVHKITAGFVLEKIPYWVNTVDDIVESRYKELSDHLKPITKDERFIGKKTRHGGNYDMGKARHMVEVNNDAKRFGLNLNISEWRAGKNLNRFHAFTPKVREVYHEEIKEQVKRKRSLTNPFGRVRQFFDRIENEQVFKEAYAQIPQSTIADHLRMAGLRIKKRIPGIRIIVEAHDALCFMVREDELIDIAKVIREEMTRPVDFSICSLSRGQIVIPNDFKLSYTNYRDLEEWELEV